jgi:hypothetical protein
MSPADKRSAEDSVPGTNSSGPPATEIDGDITPYRSNSKKGKGLTAHTQNVDKHNHARRRGTANYGVVFTNTEMLPATAFATAKSCRPSPLKSAMTIDSGDLPTA